MLRAVSKEGIRVPGMSLKLVVDAMSEVRAIGLSHRGFDDVRHWKSFSFRERKNEVIFQNDSWGR